MVAWRHHIVNRSHRHISLVAGCRTSRTSSTPAPDCQGHEVRSRISSQTWDTSARAPWLPTPSPVDGPLGRGHLPLPRRHTIVKRGMGDSGFSCRTEPAPAPPPGRCLPDPLTAPSPPRTACHSSAGTGCATRSSPRPHPGCPSPTPPRGAPPRGTAVASRSTSRTHSPGGSRRAPPPHGPPRQSACRYAIRLQGRHVLVNIANGMPTPLWHELRKGPAGTCQARHQQTVAS